MGNLFAHQRIGDHSSYMTTKLQHTFGNHIHQSDFAAAVNQADTSLHQFLSEILCCLAVLGSNPTPGSSKNTNPVILFVHDVRIEDQLLPQLLNKSVLLQLMKKARINQLLRFE